MCTVKKDIENIPESPFLSDSSSRSSCDYDLANRKQSQMLLDMIYKNSAGSGASVMCPSGLAEFSTSGCCMKNPYEAPDLYHRNSDRAIWDELKRLRSSITEVQSTLQKLPQQIVAAFLESEPCFGIRAQLDELSDNEDDFDHLTETTNTTTTTTPSSSLGTKRCLSTCSSSDIEVLSRCSPIKCSSEMINHCKSSSQIVDISKEIAQLAKSINLISLPAKIHRTASSVPAPGDEQAAKRFVSDLFAHWEQSYQSSNDLMDNKSKAPTGNIRSPVSSEVMSFEITPPKINSCAAEEKINILPYNSNIDLNVWLK